MDLACIQPDQRPAPCQGVLLCATNGELGFPLGERSHSWAGGLGGLGDQRVLLQD